MPMRHLADYRGRVTDEHGIYYTPEIVESNTTPGLVQAVQILIIL